MAYRPVFHKDVEKFLARQERSFVESFREKLQALCRDPFDVDADVKPLRGQKGHWRLRIGGFRFLYEIRKAELFLYFYKAGSRGGIYK